MAAHHPSPLLQRRRRLRPRQSLFSRPGWYRTRLALRNPFAEGRTILHFQGAGQTTTLWVGSMLVGTHKGGYDEFDFDITEALATIARWQTQRTAFRSQFSATTPLIPTASPLTSAISVSTAASTGT